MPNPTPSPEAVEAYREAGRDASVFEDDTDTEYIDLISDAAVAAAYPLELVKARARWEAEGRNQIETSSEVIDAVQAHPKFADHHRMDIEEMLLGVADVLFGEEKIGE